MRYPLTGAAAGAVPSGLTLKPGTFCNSADDPVRPALARALKPRRIEPPRPLQVSNKTRKSIIFNRHSCDQSRLTTCRTGDIVSDSGKGGLNFLSPDAELRSLRHTAVNDKRRAEPQAKDTAWAPATQPDPSGVSPFILL
jgi:hypothetical protein